jgi:AcrR family transcriptional regulator
VVASEMFAEAGYEGLNLDAVARGAHVSRSWLYGQFPDRRALLAHLVEREAETLVHEIAASLRPGGTLEELLTNAFGLFVDYVSQRRAQYLMLFGPAASLEPEVAATLIELRDRLARAYVALFQPAMVADGVRWPSDDEARLVALSMISLAEGAVLAWLNDPRITREHLIETTVSMIRRGLMGSLA